MRAHQRQHLRPVADAPRRAGLYVRVSALLGRDGETFHSPELQLAAMRTFITGRGLVEALVVEDLDVSGREMDRPGLNRLLEAVDAGDVDAVCVLDLSRLGRNTSETLALVKRLRAQGVAVLSTTESIDDSPEGELMLTMWLGMAQHYSDSVSRRWRAIVTRRTTQLGQLHGSVPPLGYLRDGPHIRIDPAMAPAVVELFAAYAAGQAIGVAALAFSTARGFPTAR